MSILSRYMIHQTVGTFLLTLTTLAGIVWISQALRKLSLLTTKGQSAIIFFKITGLALPWLVAAISPIALLIACIYTLNRMNGDSELVVMSASGGSRWHVMRPLVMLAAGLFAILMFTNLYLVPKSAVMLHRVIAEMRADIISTVLRPGNFQSLSENLIVHVRERNRDDDLLGLAIFDFRDSKQIITYLAETGHVMTQDDKLYLVMSKGQVQRKLNKDNSISFVEFDKYVLDLSNFSRAGAGELHTPRAYSTKMLLNPDLDSKWVRENIGRLRAELHSRFAKPLYPLAFVLIAVVALGRARTTRQGRVGSVLLAAGTALLGWGAGVAATNLTVKQDFIAWAIYAPPIIMIIAPILAVTVRVPFRFDRSGWSWPFTQAIGKKQDSAA